MKTVNMTINDRLMEVEGMRLHIIKTAKEQIAEFMEQAKTDFCNFFHWNADSMYRLQMMLDYFSEMPRITTHDDIEALIGKFGRRINKIEVELINTSAFGSCTNEIVNLEHRLKLTGKQNIREKLLHMMWVLEED